MADNSGAPKIYIPSKSESQGMVKSIDNILMTDDERKADGERINKLRQAMPKSPKKAKKGEIQIDKE